MVDHFVAFILRTCDQLEVLKLFLDMAVQAVLAESMAATHAVESGCW